MSHSVVGDGSHRPPRSSGGLLVQDLRDAAGTDGAATFTDRESQTFVHGDGLNELDAHVRVVTRHNHVLALGQVHNAGDVGRPEVELRTVVVEERSVPAALILGKDVGLCLELRVRVIEPGLQQT